MEPSELSLNDGTTEKHLYVQRTFKQKWLHLCVKLPVPEKCCGCLPLRHGFLVLAHLKLVVNVVLLLGILYILLLMILFMRGTELPIQCTVWFGMFLDLVDTVVGIFIIVSAYKKNVRVMEIYYRYSIYVFGLLIIICSVIFHIMFGHMYALIIFLLLFMLIMLMQVYLILMVRGEVLKLRSNAQFKFLNNEPEPLCTYTNNDDIQINT